MKVKELIDKLQKFDPEEMVVVTGYEGGYDEINDACRIRLNLNVNSGWHIGKHEQDADGECRAVEIR